jgi:c-di-GMP-binding flagellar brake protein YcgR
MQLKRRHKRYEVDFIEITGKMMHAKYIKILDMSVGGIAIQTDKRLKIGGEYSITIEGKGRILNVKVIVAWSSLIKTIRDAENNIIPIYKAGLKFTDISGETVNEIVNFLEDYKRDSDKQVDLFRLNGRRLHVRIHIEDPEKAALNLPENYNVKNLSRGGMLIESQNVVPIESKFPMALVLNEDKIINFSGRVVSCRLMQEEERNFYYIGIEFLDISEKDTGILSEFIKFLDSMNESSSSLQS